MAENNNKTQDTSNKWVIKDYSKTEAERISKVQQKQNVKMQIENNIKLALDNVDKKIPEYTLPKMKQFFSSTKNNKTTLVLRYGSKIFYKGIIDDSSIVSASSDSSFVGKEDNFIAKKAILNNCLDMLNNEKWFDENYKKYEASKNESLKKAKKTRAENKKNNTTNKKLKAKAKAEKAAETKSEK